MTKPATTKKTSTKKARPKATTAPEVLQVVAERSIQWPDGSLRGRGRHRKVIGYDAGHRAIREEVQAYTVAADDPFIKGWDHNLEPAPEGAVPVPPSEWPAKFRSQAVSRMSAASLDVRPDRTKERDLLLQQIGDGDVPDELSDDQLDSAPEKGKTGDKDPFGIDN